MGDLPKEKRLLIIDTDAGVDDAQAIVMAIGRPDVHVVAITTVQGNVSTKQVSKNVLRLLRLANRKDIPVYQGCEVSVIGAQRSATYFHGTDGFGDIPDTTEHENGEIQSEHGVLAMIRLVKENPGKLSLVAIGPLTNVALAIRLYPEFGSQLKDCFVMGGNYHGIGNSSISAEFNFYNDPEAAHIVLSELKCTRPITLVCWEVCLDFSLTWEQYEQWLPETGRVSRFLKQAETFCVDFLRKNGYQFIVCDEVAVAASFDSSVIREATPAVAHVEMAGSRTRGQMVVDWKSKDPPNVLLIRKFDLEKLSQIFRDALRELEKDT
ncbi:nucleoside hydrolase-like isoform X2 [Liolophura sinensis]